MNEIILNMPIPAGIMATLKRKLNPLAVRDIVVTGFKFECD